MIQGFRPEFGQAVSARTGVPADAVEAGRFTVPTPPNDPNEQFLPTVSEAFATRTEAINRFAQAGKDESDPAVQAADQACRAILSQFPGAEELFARVMETAGNTSLPVAFAPLGPSMFSVDLHTFDMRHATNSIIYPDKNGTLYVDTTPGEAGVEAYFHPNPNAPKDENPFPF